MDLDNTNIPSYVLNKNTSIKKLSKRMRATDSNQDLNNYEIKYDTKRNMYVSNLGTTNGGVSNNSTYSLHKQQIEMTESDDRLDQHSDVSTDDLLICSDRPFYTTNSMTNFKRMPLTQPVSFMTSNNFTPKKEYNMEYVIKLMKKAIRMIEKTKVKTKNMDLINDDWKEVASRVDLILFIIACSIVTLCPIFFFGKFFIRDHAFFVNNVNKHCSCDHS
jgi:hypothetical protein